MTKQIKEKLESLSFIIHDWFEQAPEGREKHRYEAILKTIEKLIEEIDVEKCAKCQGFLKDHKGIKTEKGFICSDCALIEL